MMKESRDNLEAATAHHTGVTPPEAGLRCGVVRVAQAPNIACTISSSLSTPPLPSCARRRRLSPLPPSRCCQTPLGPAFDNAANMLIHAGVKLAVNMATKV